MMNKYSKSVDTLQGLEDCLAIVEDELDKYKKALDKACSLLSNSKRINKYVDDLPFPQNIKMSSNEWKDFLLTHEINGMFFKGNENE